MKCYSYLIRHRPRWKWYIHYKRFIDRGTQKFFRYITAYGKKCLRHILVYLYCIKHNKINICHSNIQKQVSSKKWYQKYKHFVYRLMQKFSNTLRPEEEKCLKHILTYLLCTKYHEINLYHSGIQKHNPYKKL